MVIKILFYNQELKITIKLDLKTMLKINKKGIHKLPPN